MTWRQGISHGSFDSNSSLTRRSASPRKSLARLSMSSVRHPDSPSLRPVQANEHLGSGLTGTPKTSISMDRTRSQSVSHSEDSTPPHILGPERTHSDDHQQRASQQNPMAVYNGQSWLFWQSPHKKVPTGSTDESNRPNLDPRFSDVSQLSRLTSELSNQEHSTDEEEVASRGDSGIHCRQCGSEKFKVKFAGGDKVLACGRCGRVVEDRESGGGKEKMNRREMNPSRGAYK
jgi:ribosomal protein S27E